MLPTTTRYVIGCMVGIAVVLFCIRGSSYRGVLVVTANRERERERESVALGLYDFTFDVHTDAEQCRER